MTSKQTKKFELFARDRGISSNNLHSFSKFKYNTFPGRQIPSGMTPMIIEERQLNISAVSVFDRLMMDKIIFLGEEIDDFIANIINAQLLFLDNESESDSKEPIWLYINSPGGECYSGLAIYDTMQAIKTPIYTCVMGMAASMAFILAIAGKSKHRYALKHSRLMMHQPWAGGGGGQATDIEIFNREMQSLKADMIKIMAQHTGQTEEQIKLDAERDFWLKSEQAKAYGAIDKILLKN